MKGDFAVVYDSKLYPSLFFNHIKVLIFGKDNKSSKSSFP